MHKKAFILTDPDNLTFKTNLTQSEQYGIYAYLGKAFCDQYEHTDVLYPDEVESKFGFAPIDGKITCSNHVEWPGFEHLGPVDYFKLTENDILCAVFVYDDISDVVYLSIHTPNIVLEERIKSKVSEERSLGIVDA